MTNLEKIEEDYTLDVELTDGRFVALLPIENGTIKAELQRQNEPPEIEMEK